MENILNFNIFDDNNLKHLKEILNMPNDNYTCSECERIPEIEYIDYGTGEIVFKCKIHGKKQMPLKTYLLKMSDNVYYSKKCSFCHEIQKNDNKHVFDYCLFCKKIICDKCRKKHTHTQILKLNDLDNKCLKHHNKLYEFYCTQCEENYCSSCKEHDKHKELHSSYDFLPTKEIKILKNSNDLFKKEMEILPYLIKINELLITCQSKYSFNYYHNTNLKNAAMSFIQTDLFLKEIEEFKEKLKSNSLTFASMVKPIFQGIKVLKSVSKEIEEQQKLLEEFNKLYNVHLNGKEIKLELNDKGIGDSGLELLSKIKFPNLEKIKLSNNNISKIGPICKISSKAKKIDLSINKILDLTPLGEKKGNFNELNELRLNDNIIEDISVLTMKEAFPHLEKLDISNNRLKFNIIDVQRDLEILQNKLIKFKYMNTINYSTVTNYSSVLTSDEDIELLNERFKLKNPKIRNIQYILLYRGTRDGDRAIDMHKKIDGISKTLCIIKCPKGTFGGYTEATWDGDNCDKEDNNAFCFSLTLKKIYELKEGNDAIGCNKDYGPIFRFTFLLNDQYFTKNGFIYPTKNHFNVEENKFELSGGEKYPKIIEFEAFQIIFD